MGGAFSRGRKDRVKRIRRRSVPSNDGRTAAADGQQTPTAERPESCPAVPSPAAELWAASGGKRSGGSLLYRAPAAAADPGTLSGLVSTGGPIEVRDWLRLVGLPQYAGAMEDAGWDDTLSCHLMTEADLRDVGVEKVGHRRRLLQAIDSLRDSMRGEGQAPGMGVRIGLGGDAAAPLLSASTAAFAVNLGAPTAAATAWLEPEPEPPAAAPAAPLADRWKSDLLSRAMLFSATDSSGSSSSSKSSSGRKSGSGSTSSSNTGWREARSSSAGGAASGTGASATPRSNTAARSQYQPAAMAFLASSSHAGSKDEDSGSASAKGLPPKTVGVTRSTKGKEPAVDADSWAGRQKAEGRNGAAPRQARMSPDCHPPPNRRQYQRAPLAAVRTN
jgi:hypothetical protein